MKRGWQSPPKNYNPVGPYGPGGVFPMKRLDAIWVVVDECWRSSAPRRLEKIWRWLFRINPLLEVKLHDDRDDPDHVFLEAGAWHLWPNKRKLADWYNAPYRKTMRMRIQRLTQITAQDRERLENEFTARDALTLQSLILTGENDFHVVGDLDWSPSGQVWRNGKRWVTIPPCDPTLPEIPPS